MCARTRHAAFMRTSEQQKRRFGTWHASRVSGRPAAKRRIFASKVRRSVVAIAIAGGLRCAALSCVALLKVACAHLAGKRRAKKDRRMSSMHLPSTTYRSALRIWRPKILTGKASPACNRNRSVQSQNSAGTLGPGNPRRGHGGETRGAQALCDVLREATSIWDAPTGFAYDEIALVRAVLAKLWLLALRY